MRRKPNTAILWWKNRRIVKRQIDSGARVSSLRVATWGCAPEVEVAEAIVILD
jgi:hypothetical protein